MMMVLRFACLAACASAVSHDADPSLRERVNAALAQRAAPIIEIRRDLHRHPELSGAETRTAATVAARLRALGLEVRTGIGGHGVVAILTGGRPGPLLAYRADMDAFPSEAPDPVAFASTTPGVRHICGHDLHTSMGLALAEGLVAVRNELPGRVMFIFQPAEERATGANAMLAAGLFDRERPEAIYALHTAPLPVGVLGTKSGGLMPGRDAVTVTVAGTGDLAGVANSARRVLEGVGTLTQAQALAPAPPDFVFAEVGAPQRVTDTTWVVRGSLTIADSAVRVRTRARVLDELSRLSRADVRVTPAYATRAIAGVTNDAALTSRANDAIRSALGASAVIDITDIFPAFSEDFGSFQQRVPGVFYFLGVANAGKGWSGMPHSPDYVADEAALLVGARAMAAVILDRLGVR
jgi:metal-dependent amidase/aminoacylase/carboxypeptidase family protein